MNINLYNTRQFANPNIYMHLRN